MRLQVLIVAQKLATRLKFAYCALHCVDLQYLRAGVKRNLWLVKSLTSPHLRMRIVLLQVIYFASD